MATVILLEGDTKRATATAEQFIATIQNADYQAILRATWSEMAGNLTPGFVAGRKHEVHQARNSRHGAHRGDRLAVDESRISPAPSGLPTKSRSERWPRHHSGRRLTSGDRRSIVGGLAEEGPGLCFASRAQAADSGLWILLESAATRKRSAEWKKAYDASEGTDLRARAMLASSLDRAGNSAEARKIRVEPFLIRDFADVYGAVAFAEMRRMAGLPH